MEMAYMRGRGLLQRVATEYRNNPDFWAYQSFGFYTDGTMVPSDPPADSLDRLKKCCPDVALILFAPEYGPAALGQARELLNHQIGGWTRDPRLRIQRWNDKWTRTVDQVIDCLERAATMKQEDLAPIHQRVAQWLHGLVLKIWSAPIPALG